MAFAVLFGVFSAFHQETAAFYYCLRLKAPFGYPAATLLYNTESSVLFRFTIQYGLPFHMDFSAEKAGSVQNKDFVIE